MEVKINKEIRLHGSNLFGLSPKTVYLFGISLRDCRWALFLLHPYMSMETVSWICVLGAAPMCSARVCKISWNDSGAVYLGMDKIRNPDAEKLVFRSENLYFDA